MSNRCFKYWTSAKMTVLLAILIFITLPLPNASAASFSASWPYKANLLQSTQIVVVETKSIISQKGFLSLREKQDGKWVSVLTGIPVTIGPGGIGKTKEGDGRTPSGVYPLGQAFGTAAKPEGLMLKYMKTTKYDYWVDDHTSAQYNQWVSYTGNPDQRWNSYERLLQPLYKYAIILRYNDAPIIAGKGSAIFLHVWRDSDQPTAGCIAMSESNLLKLMKLLDPALSPAIAIGIAG